MNEPLTPDDARRLVRKILEEGEFEVSEHAGQELQKDNLDLVDVTNVLRGGWCEPPEFENGSWRYKFCTQRMVVVVAFDSEDRLAVITAWRERKGGH